MNYSAMYESLCRMVYEFDKETARTGGNYVISHPELCLSHNIPFYAEVASLLLYAKEGLDGKPKSILSAVKRILAVNGAGAQLDGVFQYGDSFCVCNGYVLLRFNEDIESLPHCENNKNFDVDRAIGDVSTGYKLFEDISIPELRAYIAADKARWKSQHGNKKYKPLPFQVTDGHYLNAQYLLDILQALPGAEVWIHDNPMNAYYIKAKTGDGVLLPVRPPKDKE